MKFHIIVYAYFWFRVYSNENYLWMAKELYPILQINLKSLRRHLGRLSCLPEHVYTHAADSRGNMVSFITLRYYP